MTTEDTARHGLLSQLAARGYQSRMVTAQRLRDLQEAIESQREDGQLNEEFYRERLSGFHYNPPEALRHARSLIVVAVPRPQTEAVFTWQDRRVSLILPPTYTDYRRVAQDVASLLAGVVEPAGYQVALLPLVPLKLLAVRSGLAAYGRNNICYVSGMGSFLELVGLASDLPCAEDHWQEARMMEACQTCHACTRHCPAGAIPEDRFLLRAERCIVFHNERPGHIPFPPWMDPSWHNSLEGCMHCQWVCPENRPFRGWIEGTEEFSEEETALLLKGVPQEGLPEETIGKLERLDVLGDLQLFPRNLGVFLSG